MLSLGLSLGPIQPLLRKMLFLFVKVEVISNLVSSSDVLIKIPPKNSLLLSVLSCAFSLYSPPPSPTTGLGTLKADPLRNKELKK